MPLERLPLSPKGEPIATTGSPIRTAPESPKRSGGTSPCDSPRVSTATSTDGSTPRTAASTRRPPRSTSTVVRSPTT